MLLVNRTSRDPSMQIQELSSQPGHAALNDKSISGGNKKLSDFGIQPNSEIVIMEGVNYMSMSKSDRAKRMRAIYL